MKDRSIITGIVLAILTFAASFAHAGKADVVAVAIRPLGDRTYQIDVTVAHADEGWSHYADKWDVLAPGGQVLGTRVLLHPHEAEQPFTRGLTLVIPNGIDQVEVRAHDSVHGYGGRLGVITVP